jgi:hypothetical protein
MTNEFPHKLITGAAIVAVIALTSLTIATASPTRGGWTEQRDGCSYTCHWYLASALAQAPQTLAFLVP